MKSILPRFSVVGSGFQLQELNEGDEQYDSIEKSGVGDSDSVDDEVDSGRLPAGYGPNPPGVACKVTVTNMASGCTATIKEVYVTFYYTDGSYLHVKKLKLNLKYGQSEYLYNDDTQKCVAKLRITTMVVINGALGWPQVILTSIYPNLCIIDNGIIMHCP